jgi:geranyl-CoA carboxylase alpha subunit
VPQPGKIEAWRFPEIDGLRIDHGLGERADIPRHYDSMIAKLIAHAPTRELARQRLVSALQRTHLLGIKTNRDFLLACLQAQAFSEPFGDLPLSTRWLDQSAASFVAPKTDSRWLAVAASLMVHGSGLKHGALAQWSNMRGMRIPMRLQPGDEATGGSKASKGIALVVQIQSDRQGSYRVISAEDDTKGEHLPAFTVEIPLGQSLLGLRAVSLDGMSHPVFTRIGKASTGPCLWLDAFGLSGTCIDLSMVAPDLNAGQGASNVIAKMHGQVRGLAVIVNQIVQQGERILSLEAMKMEHSINAPCSGTIKAIHVQETLQVSPGRLMIEIEPSPV